MFEIYESPEYKAKREAEDRKRKAKERRYRTQVMKLRAAAAVTWLPIADCPFDAFDDAYGIDGTMLVTDGTEMALVKVTRRFGTPMITKNPGKMVMRDGEMRIEGVELERPDCPDWWFKWELIDQNGYDSEMYGKPEIEFVPTHFAALPLPLSARP